MCNYIVLLLIILPHRYFENWSMVEPVSQVEYSLVAYFFWVIKVYACSCATGMLLVQHYFGPYTKLHITILIATEIEVRGIV